MRHIHMRFPYGKAKCLTLSYDDNVQQDAQLIQLMTAYGIAGTFNIGAGTYVSEGTTFPEGHIHRRLTQAQSTALYSQSDLLEVATHGYTHPFLDRLPAAQATYEVLTDRRCTEAQFGKLCRGHAYPYGTYNQQVMDCLRACGIVYARTIRATGQFALPEDFLQWHPTCHHKDSRLGELTERFLQEPVKQLPRLFYLWGHSYEFEKDGNWHIIEDFFKKVSGREDIWYATNIQIYDYKTAYDQLIWNADCSAVHNPTATDLWFQVDTETYCVHAGQTTVL